MIGLLVVLIALLPTLIAFRRKHEHRIGITFLNLLAGWTGIGWIVALVWAMKPEAASRMRGALKTRPPKSFRSCWL